MSRADYIGYLRTLKDEFAEELFIGVSVGSEKGLSQLRDLYSLRSLLPDVELPEPLATGLAALFRTSSVTSAKEDTPVVVCSAVDLKDVFDVDLQFVPELETEEQAVSYSAFGLSLDDLAASIDDLDDLFGDEVDEPKAEVSASEEGVLSAESASVVERVEVAAIPVESTEPEEVEPDNSEPEVIEAASDCSARMHECAERRERRSRAEVLAEMVSPKSETVYTPGSWLSEGDLVRGADLFVEDVESRVVEPAVMSFDSIELAADLSDKLEDLAVETSGDTSRLERLSSIASGSEALTSVEGITAQDDGLVKFFLRTGVRVAGAFQSRSEKSGGPVEILPDSAPDESMPSRSRVRGYQFDESCISPSLRSGLPAADDAGFDTVPEDEVEISLRSSLKSIGSLFSRGASRFAEEAASLSEKDTDDDYECIRGIRQVFGSK